MACGNRVGSKIIYSEHVVSTIWQKQGLMASVTPNTRKTYSTVTSLSLPLQCFPEACMRLQSATDMTREAVLLASVNSIYLMWNASNRAG
jgi:hypothetical protein